MVLFSLIMIKLLILSMSILLHLYKNYPLDLLFLCFSHQYQQHLSNSLFLKLHIMITNILCSLNASHACDVNNLNMIFLKTHASTLIPLFHHLVNLCIRQSVFPAMWKTAQITPIFKSDDPTNVSNYRPIAILPTVSKLLEKTSYNQLISYLEDNNLLSDCQHGFRPLRSTMSALLLFTEQIRASLNKGQVTGVVYIDFRKAFDTVNHIFC